MEVKTFEVRDEATFIPCVGIWMAPSRIHRNEAENYLLRRAGYGLTEIVPLVLFGRLHSGEFQHDYYGWGHNETMKWAHKFVTDQWEGWRSGDVIDVQFLRGETMRPKKSERLEHPL